MTMPTTTKLTRPVRRESFTIVRDKSKRRALVCALLPGDVLEFRLKGTRTRYTVGMDAAYQYAGRLAGEAARRARKAGK